MLDEMSNDDDIISMSNFSIKSPMKLQQEADAKNLRISNLIKIDPYDALTKTMIKERHMLYSKAIKDPEFKNYPKFTSVAFYDIRFSQVCRNKYLKLKNKPTTD